VSPSFSSDNSCRRRLVYRDVVFVRRLLRSDDMVSWAGRGAACVRGRSCLRGCSRVWRLRGRCEGLPPRLKLLVSLLESLCWALFPVKHPHLLGKHRPHRFSPPLYASTLCRNSCNAPGPFPRLQPMQTRPMALPCASDAVLCTCPSIKCSRPLLAGPLDASPRLHM
jgi:hypothetical protein